MTNIALSSGSAFVIGADKQFNAAVVVSRGLELSGSYQSGMAELALAADTIGRKASFCFEAGERASRGSPPHLKVAHCLQKPQAGCEGWIWCHGSKH